MDASTILKPPAESQRDDFERCELRAAPADDPARMPRLTGYAIRFAEWARINSVFEGGPFLERIEPGATRKTLAEQGDRIKLLFNHGYDPQLGERPIAPTALAEDDRGVRYDDPELYATEFNRTELVPLLEGGALGSSFRFRVTREDFVGEPGVSDHNPDGIPERSITELQMLEAGPVTFPAYAGTTAGVRSTVDEFVETCIRRNPTRAAEIIAQALGIPAAQLARAADLSAVIDKSTDDDHTSDQSHPDPVPRRDRTRPLYGERIPSKVPAWKI